MDFLCIKYEFLKNLQGFTELQQKNVRQTVGSLY